METYLGIDGGGTKTAALIMEPGGSERGRGTGGAGNIATSSAAILRRSLQEAVTGAAVSLGATGEPLHFRGVCAGVAGYSVESRREEFAVLLREEISADTYRIEPDYLIAYWGATHGEPGIVVIAGTGAVAFGRNEEGQTYKEDGLGYLLGDRGSGFDLGLYALRYTLHRLQEGQTDVLTQAVLEHTGATRVAEIMQWLYGNFSPTRVASLSPIIGRLAEAGDPDARNLASEMARRLRHTVRQVRHKLWMPRDIPVYPLGGLWQLGPFFREEFVLPKWPGANGVHFENDSTTGGYFHLAEPKSDPAYGAALMARE